MLFFFKREVRGETSSSAAETTVIYAYYIFIFGDYPLGMMLILLRTYAVFENEIPNKLIQFWIRIGISINNNKNNSFIRRRI